MSPSLPAQPDLEHLRKQAKALLRAAESADTDAIARLRTVPRLASLPDAELAETAQLADAQHAIAREQGAESWPQLKAAVEAGLPLEVQAEYFLRRVRDSEDAQALRWLERVPAIAGVNVFTAAAAGDEAAVKRLLAAEPALATATHSLRAVSALLYAGASPLPADSPALARIARELLEAGADANSAHAGEGEGPPQSALYYACARGHTGVARALLEHGARTQDGESIYHAAEHNRVACLEALLEHGADLGGRQEPWGNTPLFFLAGYPEGSPRAATAHDGMRWLLDHGADPNVTSGKTQETPLHQVIRVGGGVAIARALLDSGADPNAARADGRTPCMIAFRYGRIELLELLRSRGAKADFTVLDQFIGAATAGDETRARELLAASPDLFASFDDEDRGLLAMVAGHGRTDLALLLIRLGFDLSWQAPWGGTALHTAAWHGHVQLAGALVEAGAPLEVRDTAYGSSPLGWAVHGSQHCRHADEEYLAIVRRLLEAGAGRTASINRWGEPPENLGSKRVVAFLQRWYREHPDALAT